MSIGDRLREERERLGFSQASFAEITGAHRKSQGNYELGERMPDAAYLAAIAAAGADVLYILTGVRVGEIKLSPEIPLTITREEAALLDNYRNSPPEGQAAIKATSAALAQRSVHPQGVGRGSTADKSATATLKKGKAA